MPSIDPTPRFSHWVLIAFVVMSPLPSSGCSNSGGSSSSGGPAELVLVGGRVFTADEEKPWAEAVAISEGRFVFVGDDTEAEAYVGAETRRVALEGRMVIPGIIDAHTHPGLVSILGDGNLGIEPESPEPEDDGLPPFPMTSVEDMQDWLRQLAASTEDIIITSGAWPVGFFGVEGPRKEIIDEVIPNRFVVLFDDTGHSQWANSVALDFFGVDEETPDPAPGLSFFVRDEQGQPTGWIKEFAAVQVGGDLLLPSDEGLRANLRAVIDWFAARGVTSLMDAGNLEFGEKVFKILSDFDKAGELPLRYEASFHLFLPGQNEIAIDELNRLRDEYGGDRLTFDTIKVHLDGVFSIRTSAMKEPYSDEPTNSGTTLLTEAEMTQLLLDMQGQDMNFHVHAVGDRAISVTLDAVAAAQEAVGGELDSRVTISHVTIIDDADAPRFAELGVLANFTPHWHGSLGENSVGPLGPERHPKRLRAKLLHDAGAVVTYSSDVSEGLGGASPFDGIQIGHTRQRPELGTDAPILQPVEQRLSIEQLLQGYTANGAYQLGWEDRLGSIEQGKLADLVILDRDLFEIDPYTIRDTMPVTVLFEGEVTQGALP